MCTYVFVGVTGGAFEASCIILMDIYAIGADECIHVNTCKRVLPGSECVSVFQLKRESQSLASAELNEAE